MAEPDRPESERAGAGRPIVAGLIALVSVGLVVGLILGGVAVLGVNLLGLGGDDDGGEATARQTLYVPKPAKTTDTSGPDYTLAPEGSESAEADDETGSEEESEGASPSKSEAPEKEITLSISATEASPMQQVDLSGVYPGGEGAILQVQRMTGGKWLDFPVTVSVSGGQFQTYVQTSQAGENRFRVVDTDSERKSNVVRVTIG